MYQGSTGQCPHKSPPSILREIIDSNNTKALRVRPKETEECIPNERIRVTSEKGFNEKEISPPIKSSK